MGLQTSSNKASRGRWRGAVCTVLLTAFVACGYPQIRVRNDSPYRLESIKVYADTVVRDFGSLKPGESSDYTTVGEATEWQRVEATLGNGGGVVFDPNPKSTPGTLGPGFWTYHLRVEDVAGKPESKRLKMFVSKDAYPPDT